jgi:hypothetical protein
MDGGNGDGGYNLTPEEAQRLPVSSPISGIVSI